jgi:uncharacterized protein YjbJ (UPF0337 family)
MNAQKLQGQWNELAGKIKEKWGQLTDDDLRISNGNIEQVIGRIQQRTGQSREAIEHFLDQLSSEGQNMAAHAAQAVNRIAQNTSEKVRENLDYMGDRAHEGYEQTARFVRSKPGQSLAAVFGVGVGLGLLLGLTLRSRD